MERHGEASEGGHWVPMSELLEVLSLEEVNESLSPWELEKMRRDAEAEQAAEDGPEAEAMHLMGVEIDPVDENLADM
jgi:hypothetical protein